MWARNSSRRLETVSRHYEREDSYNLPSRISSLRKLCRKHGVQSPTSPQSEMDNIQYEKYTNEDTEEFEQLGVWRLIRLRMVQFFQQFVISIRQRSFEIAQWSRRLGSWKSFTKVHTDPDAELELVTIDSPRGSGLITPIQNKIKANDGTSEQLMNLTIPEIHRINEVVRVGIHPYSRLVDKVGDTVAYDRLAGPKNVNGDIENCLPESMYLRATSTV